MRIVLPSDQTLKLQCALTRSGSSEIGGQLFGEQLAPSNFKITELTIQTRPGSIARFVVDLVELAGVAAAFFRKTAHRYDRHNYIGEWHSHPSFAVSPSRTDSDAMRELVSARDFVGSFAVLMIVRLDGADLQAGAWVFDKTGRDQPVCLEREDGRRW